MFEKYEPESYYKFSVNLVFAWKHFGLKSCVSFSVQYITCTPRFDLSVMLYEQKNVVRELVTATRSLVTRQTDWTLV